MLKGEVLMIDLDGVLCKREAWTKEDCLNAEPIKQNIKKVNRLSQGNLIVIWTARCDDLITSSIKWLKRNGVSFDAISNKKPGASYYVDDKSVDLDALIKEV